MEASSSEFSLSFWDYVHLLFLRPAVAIAFVLSFIALGWFLAWKLVLVHVPLVQEICGLRRKPAKPKPPTRRLSKIYSNIDARNSASECFCYLKRFPPFHGLNMRILDAIHHFYFLLHDRELDAVTAFLCWKATVSAPSCSSCIIKIQFDNSKSALADAQIGASSEIKEDALCEMVSACSLMEQPRMPLPSSGKLSWRKLCVTINFD